MQRKCVGWVLIDARFLPWWSFYLWLIGLDSSFPEMWLKALRFQPRSLLNFALDLMTSFPVNWDIVCRPLVPVEQLEYMISASCTWFTSHTRSSRLRTSDRKRFVISWVDELRMSSAGQSSPHDHKDQGVLFEYNWSLDMSKSAWESTALVICAPIP